MPNHGFIDTEFPRQRKTGDILRIVSIKKSSSYVCGNEIDYT